MWQVQETDEGEGEGDNINWDQNSFNWRFDARVRYISSLIHTCWSGPPHTPCVSLTSTTINTKLIPSTPCLSACPGHYLSLLDGSAGSAAEGVDVQHQEDTQTLRVRIYLSVCVCVITCRFFLFTSQLHATCDNVRSPVFAHESIPACWARAFVRLSQWLPSVVAATRTWLGNVGVCYRVCTLQLYI